jgi:hypothetical protein
MKDCKEFAKELVGDLRIVKSKEYIVYCRNNRLCVSFLMEVYRLLKETDGTVKSFNKNESLEYETANGDINKLWCFRRSENSDDSAVIPPVTSYANREYLSL